MFLNFRCWFSWRRRRPRGWRRTDGRRTRRNRCGGCAATARRRPPSCRPWCRSTWAAAQRRAWDSSCSSPSSSRAPPCSRPSAPTAYSTYFNVNMGRQFPGQLNDLLFYAWSANKLWCLSLLFAVFCLPSLSSLTVHLRAPIFWPIYIQLFTHTLFLVNVHV